MSKTNDSKTVREARAEARRAARKGERTYQQCLDDAARGRGHAHWAAFQAAHPQVEVQEDGIHSSASARPSRPFSLRALIAGGDPVREERRRAALVVAEAALDEAPTPSALRLKAALQVVYVGGQMLALCMIMLMIPTGGVLHDIELIVGIPAGCASYVAAAALLALAIGDHPGMERRRAQARNLATLVQIGGVLAMAWAFAGSMGQADVTHAIAVGNLMATLLLGGSVVRNGTSRAMALAAASAPAGAGSSMMDIDAAMDAPDEPREVGKVARSVMERLAAIIPTPWFGIAALGVAGLSAVAVVAIFVALAMLAFAPHAAGILAMGALVMLAPAALAATGSVLVRLAADGLGVLGPGGSDEPDPAVLRAARRARSK